MLVLEQTQSGHIQMASDNLGKLPKFQFDEIVECILYTCLLSHQRDLLLALV